MNVQCARCGKSFDVQPARLKHGRGKHCSRDCQYAAAREAPKALSEAVCKGCGSTFTFPRAAAKQKGRGSYCSRRCRDKNRVGENIPNYRGGSEKTYSRGPNWQSQRRAALERDNDTCQECDATGDMQVHHIIPFRLFDDYREANLLSNLLTLCPPCHRKADAAIQGAGL